MGTTIECIECIRILQEKFSMIRVGGILDGRGQRLGSKNGGSVLKNPPANAGDARAGGSIPGLGRFAGVGNGNLL